MALAKQHGQHVKWILTITIIGSMSRSVRSDAECPFVAHLSGDETATVEVERWLQTLGIQTTPHLSCPSVEVIVQKRDGRYTLRILSKTDDAYVREVESAKTVAVLIDAQAQEAAIGMPHETDNAEKSGDPPASGDQPQEAPTTAPPPKAATPDPEADAPAPEQRKSQIQLAFEATYATDRTFWTGVVLSVCGKLGPICLGVRARYANDTGVGGVSDTYGLNRLLLEGALFAHILMEWGRVFVNPGVSIGGGYLACWKYIDNGRDETELGQHGGARAGFFVSLAIRVLKNLYVEALSLNGTFLLPVHEDRYAGDEEIEAFTVREPRAFVRGGIGIRYDLPFGT